MEFDHRHPLRVATQPFTYSYGERVAVHPVDSYEPFVRRAENHARAHKALVDVLGRPTVQSASERTWPTGPVAQLT